MKKIKTWDPVIVIAWKHKGKISTVEKVDGDKLFLKWVNEVKKAVKGQGFVKKTLPIHLSNCMYYDEKNKKPSRIWIKITKKKSKDGEIIKRKRYLKKNTDRVID